MLRKLIWIWIFYIVISATVFADTQVILDVNNNQISLWDDVSLKLNIKTRSWWVLDIISFQGLDNFHQSWTSQSQSYMSNNWDVSIQFTIRYNLSSKDIWDFIIWPAIVSLWWTEYISNTVRISVWMVQKKDIQEENEVPEDFHWLRKINSEYIFLPVIIFLFLIMFYFLLIKFLKKNREEVRNESDNSQLWIDPIIIVLEKLKALQKNCWNISKDQFYKEMNDIFREYFIILWIPKAFQSTFKEIERTKVPKEILALFKKCYYHEFSLSWEDEKGREMVINNFIKILKK